MIRYLAVTGIFALSFCAAVPAFSQDLAREQMMRRQAARLGAGPVVQSSFSANMPLDNSGDITAQQTEALRSFYRMAEGSCAEVLATVASSCEIASLSSSVNVLEHPSRGLQLSVKGDVVMKVQFRNAATP